MSSIKKISSEVFIILKQFDKYLLNCQDTNELKNEATDTRNYLLEYYDFLNVNFFPELNYLEIFQGLKCFDNVVSCSFRIPRSFKNISTLNETLNELERITNLLSEKLTLNGYFKLAELIYQYNFCFIYRIGSLVQVTSY